MIVLVLLAGALLAPGLLIGPSLDAAVFSHLGGRLLDGVAPYVGAWDHKPPGIYLASAAVQAVLGWLGPWTADWLLSLGATAGIGVAVAAVLARLGVTGWPRTLVAVGSVVLASNYLLALGGGLTEPIAAVLVASALVLALRPLAGTRQVLAGALVGAALIFSFQVLPGALVVIAVAMAGTPARGRMARVARLAVGAAAPVALVAAWLALIGALPAALDAIVTYTAAYRFSNTEYGGTLSAPVASWTLLVSLFLVAPAILGARSISAAPSPRRTVVVASLAWIAASLALFVVQGRFLAHYAIPLAVPLGILGGVGLQRVMASLHRSRALVRRAVVVAPFAATMAISVMAGVISAAMQLAAVADMSERSEAVATYVRETVSEGGMLVWGNDPRLYDLAGRSPTTRYSYFYPLSTPGYSTTGMVDEVARELAADPPAVVVDAGSSAPGQPGFLPLLINRPITTDGRDLDLLDPLRAFVATHYKLAATVAGWPIYVLRDEPTP